MTQQRAPTLKLDKKRLHWKESNAGNTVQVPSETFLAHYTNLLHSRRKTDTLVAHIEKGLKTENVLSRNGWTATYDTEDSVFERLEDIVESIHDQCVDWNKTKQHPKLQQRTTRLICRLNHITASEARGGSMRIDARFILIKEDGKAIDSEHVPTSAVVAVAQFKTRLCAKNRIDNESKALRAIGHILYADPCRRSVIAFTMEDHLMRFWYFSRSHIAVSAAFDYYCRY
ncbi:hypothetical protein CPB85DRAFT_1444955 [Mucidula mucida]|nr:hypothetical protein CPB85DRAFT_1444955 [Mucidula mucida]